MKHLKLLLTTFAIFSITLSFSQQIEYKKLTPPQKKVYNYFWDKKQWTYATMNALKPLEIKAHLKKAGVDVTKRDEFMPSYSFFKRIRHAKNGKETAERFKRRLKQNN